MGENTESPGFPGAVLSLMASFTNGDDVFLVCT
nr:MAG TPA: hypothetical protein [Caudoviricetes sp.]